MTDEELVNDFPSLLHMAERGSWPNIKLHGLLSTTTLLDVYGYSGNVRHSIERRHRPESVPLSSPDMLVATVRDQKPMTDDSLRRALPEDMSPEEWYAILNSKTFFWTSEKRLLRLLCARPYRDKVHDVLTVNTKLLIERHRHNIVLCPINSGCTKPFPHKRNRHTFLSIEKYPYNYWKSKRPKWDAVVEAAVETGVPDVIDCVDLVREMRGDRTLGIVWVRDA